MPVTISGIIDGISEEIIGKMPKTQQGQIRPYVADAKLHFRQRMEKPGGAKTAKLEVRNPKPVDPTLPWTENPTGIQPALAALFPESIRIDAMDDAGADVAKQTKTNTIGKLIAEVIKPIQKQHDEELKTALQGIADKFSATGASRSEQLRDFDAGASISTLLRSCGGFFHGWPSLGRVWRGAHEESAALHPDHDCGAAGKKPIIRRRPGR